jgi:hypothetical protein
MLAQGADPCLVDGSFRVPAFSIVPFAQYNEITGLLFESIRTRRNLVDIVLIRDQDGSTLVMEAIRARNEFVLMSCLACGVTMDTDIIRDVSFLCALAAFCDAPQCDRLLAAYQQMYHDTSELMNERLLGRALLVNIQFGSQLHLASLIDQGAVLTRHDCKEIQDLYDTHNVSPIVAGKMSVLSQYACFAHNATRSKLPIKEKLFRQNKRRTILLCLLE